MLIEHQFGGKLDRWDAFHDMRPGSRLRLEAVSTFPLGWRLLGAEIWGRDFVEELAMAGVFWWGGPDVQCPSSCWQVILANRSIGQKENALARALDLM